MTTNQILIGVGLILMLAVGAQVLASRLRIPAIIGGAAKILPITFPVIVATVVLYGLTAAPVARRLHVTRPSRTRPLLVGGERWVRAASSLPSPRPARRRQRRATRLCPWGRCRYPSRQKG